jgi:hypothetical protein
VVSNFPLMCLDLRRCAFLVWSTARARALQKQTQIEWQPYRASKVLNAIYSLLFWKEGPGTAEIRQDQDKVARCTAQFFDDMFAAFLEKSFTLGPMGLAHYADNLVSTRAYALESVQQLFREASSINDELVGEANRTIKTLATIKLASALTLTGVGCYVALAGSGVVLVTQIGLVKLGADVTGEIIRPHDHIGGNVKGVAYQLGKAGAEKGSDKLVEHAEYVGNQSIKEYGPKLVSAQRRIERYSADLARRIRGRKRVVAARRLERAAADETIAERTIKKASQTVKIAEVAGKTVPLVFAAWDLMDAVSEYREDTESAE